MRHLCEINNLTNNIEILNLGISNKIGKYSVSMKEKNKWSMNTGGWQWTPDENGIEFKLSLCYDYDGKPKKCD